MFFGGPVNWGNEIWIVCRGERILFFGPNTNTNIIRNQNFDRIVLLANTEYRIPNPNTTNTQYQIPTPVF